MAVKMEVTAEILDVEEVLKAPDRIAVLVAQEMRRHGKRYRKEFIKTQFKGGSGITFDPGGIAQMVRSGLIGGRITSYQKGRRNLNELKIVSKASAFLAPYVTGGKIRENTPLWFKSKSLGGDKLLLRTPTEIRRVFKRSSRKVTKEQVKKRPMINIPATLKFRTIWRIMEPKLIKRIDNAVDRALRTSFVLNKSKYRSS